MSDIRPDARKNAIEELRRRLIAEGKYSTDIEAILQKAGDDMHAEPPSPTPVPAAPRDERVKIPIHGPSLDPIARNVLAAGATRGQATSQPKTAPQARVVDPQRRRWTYLGIGAAVALLAGVALGRMVMTQPVRSAPQISHNPVPPAPVASLPQSLPAGRPELTVETPPAREKEPEVEITQVPDSPSDSVPETTAQELQSPTSTPPSPTIVLEEPWRTETRAEVHVERQPVKPSRRSEPERTVAHAPRSSRPSRPAPTTSAPPLVQQPEIAAHGPDDPDWLERTRPRRNDVARLDVPDSTPMPESRRNRPARRAESSVRETRWDRRLGREEFPGEDEDDVRKTVRICVETGWLATRWCPHTALLNVSERKLPTRSCRVHIDPDNR